MSSFTSVPLDCPCALNIVKSRCISCTDAINSASKVNIVFTKSASCSRTQKLLVTGVNKMLDIAEVGKVQVATGVDVL